jgi:hypothetical protein
MHYDEPFMCILEQASQIWLDFIYVIHPKLQLLIKQSFPCIFISALILSHATIFRGREWGATALSQ